MARDMAEDVLKHLDELLIPINAMFSGGGVEATKSLRSNRRPLATPLEPPSRKSQVSKRLRSNHEDDEKPTPKRQK